MRAVKKILVIKPGSLGDIVHALPVLHYLRTEWPDACICWIVDSRWKELLETVEGIDELIEFPRESFRGAGGWARSVAWFASLGKIRPDLAIDLQGLMRSALMARASGASLVVGGTDAREGAGFAYKVKAQVDPATHAVDRYRCIVTAAGVCCDAPPEFPIGPGTRPADLSIGGFVLLHPYSRGDGKSFGPETVAELCRALHPAPVVLAGIGPQPGNLPPNAIDLLGRTTLREFVWLARTARFVVSVDSGPAHIAAAVNPALLAVHTWSDPARVGPYQADAHIWRGGEIRRKSELAGWKQPSSRPFLGEDIPRLAEWLLARPELASATE